MCGVAVGGTDVAVGGIGVVVGEFPIVDVLLFTTANVKGNCGPISHIPSLTGSEARFQKSDPNAPEDIAYIFCACVAIPESDG